MKKISIFTIIGLLLIISLSACANRISDSATETEVSPEMEAPTITDPTTPEMEVKTTINTTAPKIEENTEPTDKKSPTPLPPVETPKTVTPEPLVINMEAGNFYFKPSLIKAKEGQKITINFTTIGTHNFSIDALGINKPLQSGSASITFTATQKGTFEFYCNIGKHKAMGQVGTLIVE